MNGNAQRQRQPTTTNCKPQAERKKGTTTKNGSLDQALNIAEIGNGKGTGLKCKVYVF